MISSIKTALGGATTVARKNCTLYNPTGKIIPVGAVVSRYLDKTISTRQQQQVRSFSTVNFSGVFPILATPFRPSDEAVDEESLFRLVQFMAHEVKVDGVTILGVLGEANRLTDKEREKVIVTSVKAAAGKIPIVVGTSHSGTKATIDLSLMAHELGAHAVMVTPSREPTPNDDKIYEYFQKVARTVPLPIVLQDHPASTLVHMSVPLIVKIINDLPSIKCLKAEAVPTGPRIKKVKELVVREGGIQILGGLGALYGLFELREGCDGFMTGFAFPEVLQAMVKEARKGNFHQINKLYSTYLPLIVYEQQPGVAVRKELLKRRNLIQHSTVRHPGGGLGPGVAEEITALLKIFTEKGLDITNPLSIISLY